VGKKRKWLKERKVQQSKVGGYEIDDDAHQKLGSIYGGD
jgi:hypothetical protein